MTDTAKITLPPAVEAALAELTESNWHTEERVLRADIERLREAIRWACGEREGFEPPADARGRYWWRRELMGRAGMRWECQEAADGK